MELPNISTSDKLKNLSNCRENGFTLIELLIVLGLFVVILSFGLVIGFDSYRRDALRSEKNAVISALQKTRSQAINNINSTKHGFYFDGANLIVFEGNSFGSRDTSMDLTIPRNPAISISSLPDGVIFEQLRGSAVPSIEFVLSDGFASTSVLINEEGRIEW